MRNILSTIEAADIMGMQPRSIRQAIGQGRLGGEKHGRDWWITPAELARYAEARKPPGLRDQVNWQRLKAATQGSEKN